MPSRPILQACANTVGPSASMCSLSRRPGAARLNTDANVAFLVSSGSRRRSSPLKAQVEGIEENARVAAAVAGAVARAPAARLRANPLATADTGPPPHAAPCHP